MYEEVVNSILWYYTKANNSLTAILDTRSPTTEDHLRLHYGIYIESILGAIDHMQDHRYLQRNKIDNLIAPEEFKYFRELRNSVVHRGFNPCISLIVHNEIFYVHTPQEVSNKSGNLTSPPLEPFLLLFLLRVDIIFRNLINEEIVNSSLLTYKDVSLDDMFDGLATGIKDHPYIPESIKEMFFSNTTEIKESINPKKMHDSFIQKYNEIIKIEGLKENLTFLIKNLTI